MCVCTCIHVCTLCVCMCVYLCIHVCGKFLFVTHNDPLSLEQSWKKSEHIPWTPKHHLSHPSSWVSRAHFSPVLVAHLLGKWSSLVLGFRDKAVQASDPASNLPGLCSDWEWLGVTACCECKICSTLDKMGEEPWDHWAPGGGLASHSQDLTTFQDLQNKTALTWNQSCNLLTDWWCYQFASWDYKQELWIAIFEV